MDIKEAAKRLGKSEKTVRRWIDAGKLKARIVKGRYEIDNLDIMEVQMSKTDMSTKSNISSMTKMSNELITELKEQIAELRNEKENWQRERAELQSELRDARNQTEEARQRSDTIILQLTRQLEQSQLLLEYHQEPWYRKLFKKRRHEDLS